MARIESSDPDRMEFRSEISLGRFFRGLGAILFGMVFATAPLWHADRPPNAFIPFGLVFVAIGVISAFGYTGTVLDRRKRTITVRQGLMDVRPIKPRSLDLFDRVEIEWDASPRQVYPVVLRGENERVKIDAPREYARAHECAIEAARFLHLRLVDNTGQEEIALEPEELDESMRDRAERLGMEAGLPPAPPSTRVAYQVQGDNLRLQIPAPGFRFANHFAIAIGFLFAVYALTIITLLVLAIVLGEEVAPGVIIWVLLIAGAIGIWPLREAVRVGLQMPTRRVTIEVSPSLLRVTEKAFLLRRVTEIQPRDLEGLTVVGRDEYSRSHDPSRHLYLEKRAKIRAHSKGASVTFGRGLSDEELHWLKAVIEKTLTV